ncbi:helix-turn-helix domain-containing protein [Bacteroides thetaiotaomicron]|uniref:helix-turn-helix domain-containing protein n=1 Tax=Bacteroides thetaiotaomicron TaxID=818 RepID=UPI001F440D9C|nr:helix-turn-helix transcriptional regulator [Bacteroides thetaiotaomicron]
MDLRIKEICEQKGISITELGRRIGKEKSSIHTILRNANPTVETLAEIAKALDVDITELFIKQTKEDKKYVECPRCGLKLFKVEE